MKKLLLLVLVLFMGACSTEPLFTTNPTEPKDSHIICESKFYETQNTTERWMEGKWIQTEGIPPIGFPSYVEFSVDSLKGQWAVFIKSQFSPVDIIESSYKIEENYWETGSHRLISWLYKDPYQNNMLVHIEIVNVDNDKMKIYHRGFNANDLPEDTEILNPKDAVRTLGNNIYAEYQRVK